MTTSGDIGLQREWCFGQNWELEKVCEIYLWSVSSNKFELFICWSTNFFLYQDGGPPPFRWQNTSVDPHSSFDFLKNLLSSSVNISEMARVRQMRFILLVVPSWGLPSILVASPNYPGVGRYGPRRDQYFAIYTLCAKFKCVKVAGSRDTWFVPGPSRRIKLDAQGSKLPLDYGP